MHRVLTQLEELTERHPTSRKLLLAPDINQARELLFALARRTGGWIGWEPATLRTVAGDLAFVAIEAAGKRTATDLETAAAVNAALDTALAHGEIAPGFAELANGLGFRTAVRDAILELRLAGVSGDAVTRAAPAGAPAHQLGAILDEYERALGDLALADPADVFRLALQHFDAEWPLCIDAPVIVTPGVSRRGLPGLLLARLLAGGAQRLQSDAVHGLEPPAQLSDAIASEQRDGRSDVRCSILSWLPHTAGLEQAERDGMVDGGAVVVDLFRAATPDDEIREVLRRVVGEGRRWDSVEIVATDPDTYGIALDALCQRLELPATLLDGIPLARTRIGRVLDRWLRWLEEGLPADRLREALEGTELRAPGDDDVSPTALARALRSLSVGWGRARYREAFDALRNGWAEAIARFEDEEDGAFAERIASRRRTARALASLIRELLDITPAVPERGDERIVRCSTARLATATLRYLALAPAHGHAEQRTMERLRTRLQQIAEVEAPETTFGAALASLRESLADLRAWSQVSDGRKPWSATGGMVHLTDVAHAGATGRERIFVVGLDADRSAGPRLQDPLLTDDIREALDPVALPPTAARRIERAWTIARALAGLRGRVTLSYATSGTLDGRESSPSPLLLQAFRLLDRDPARSYEQLRDRLGAPACAVPARGDAALDTRDVWMSALASSAVILDGTALVRECFPSLDAGLAADAARTGATLTAHHGLVPAAAGVLDPRGRTRPISPSSLELLAACPMSWFYRYGLGLRSPTDPEYDPDAWLDASSRGALLHTVYERFCERYRGRQDEIANASARDDVLAIVDSVIQEFRRDVPPPSETVFESECGELRHAALAFLALERESLRRGDTGRWMRLEAAFGDDGQLRFELGDGTSIPVRGRVDRIDELRPRELRVIDYKTGSAWKYTRGDAKGAFNGGRLLQPTIYAHAVEQQLAPDGAPRVLVFEYRFPTARGQNDIARYDRATLALAQPIIRELLEHVTQGTFLPTTDVDDCRFCESAPICRVRTPADGNGYRPPHSPLAAWARANASTFPEYARMLQRRGGADA